MASDRITTAEIDPRCTARRTTVWIARGQSDRPA